MRNVRAALLAAATLAAAVYTLAAPYTQGH
jgi:hypothetical protein